MNLGSVSPLMAPRPTRPTLPLMKSIEEENKERIQKMINQYRILKKIGSGTDSKVYLTEDTSSDELYAIKAFDLSGKSGRCLKLSHLEREIRILANVTHKNIVSMKEVLEASDLPKKYIVMEYADVGSLKDLIESHVMLTESMVAAIFVQLIDGLMYLHSKSFVHQDIKPSNILLFADGTAKLSDFGVGHSFDSAGTMLGSPAYQAPEILMDSDKTLDPIKQDVWGLGVSLFEAAFRYIPFTGNNLYEIVNSIVHQELVVPETASEGLRDLLRRMMTVDPELRPNMEEIASHPFFKGKKRLSLVPRYQSIERLSVSKPRKIHARRCAFSHSVYHFQAPRSWPGNPDSPFYNVIDEDS